MPKADSPNVVLGVDADRIEHLLRSGRVVISVNIDAVYLCQLSTPGRNMYAARVESAVICPNVVQPNGMKRRELMLVLREIREAGKPKEASCKKSSRQNLTVKKSASVSVLKRGRSTRKR